jgi:hypothetical protein
MKAPNRRIIVPLSVLLAMALLSGCVESQEEGTVTAEATFEDSDQSSLRNPSPLGHYRTDALQRRPGDRLVDPEANVLSGLDRGLVSAFGSAPFDGVVRASAPRLGTYTLTDVQVFGPSGEAQPGVQWVGGVTFAFPNHVDLDLTQIVEDAFGNTDFGDTVSINDGTFDVTETQLMLSDDEGKLVFVFNYHYAEVDFGGDRSGHLTLNRATDQRAPVVDGQPVFMRLTRSIQ